MSRLGKLPIQIPEKTQVTYEKDVVKVVGPKGELSQKIDNKDIVIKLDDSQLVVSVLDKTVKKQRAFWGLYRSLINNMVAGVNDGFTKKLEVNGVGYRVAVSGKKIVLNVGYSHPVEVVIPEGLNVSVEGNVITINGIDKQLVGEFAAQIRRIRKPEPYKGKGIKYIDEVIVKKVGKTAAKAE